MYVSRYVLQKIDTPAWLAAAAVGFFLVVNALQHRLFPWIYSIINTASWWFLRIRKSRESCTSCHSLTRFDLSICHPSTTRRSCSIDYHGYICVLVLPDRVCSTSVVGFGAWYKYPSLLYSALQYHCTLFD